MSVVISVANQKGGVGKTVTTINLSAALASKGKKVLIIDLDPQGQSGLGFGIEPDELEKTTFDVLTSSLSLEETIVPLGENLFICPSNIELANAEQKLYELSKREGVLKKKLDQMTENFDYIIIDCPPSLGLLTLNGLIASNIVLVPVQCGFFALHGLSKLASTLSVLIKEFDLDVEVFALVTMYERITKVSKSILAEVRKLFGDNCLESFIYKNTAINEATGKGMPVMKHRPNSVGAMNFKMLADEIIELFEE